jgi:peptide/nickel transport system substrate-binding protein
VTPRLRANALLPLRPAAVKAVTALLALLALAGACKPRGTSTPGRSEQLVVYLENEPAHLLNLLQPDAWAHRITAHNLFESLVRIHPRTYAIVPELASSFSTSPDGRTLTFSLRRGVLWHDGRPFVGEDALFTLETVMDERTRAAGARASLEPFLESYRLVAPDRLELRCRRPSPRILEALADIPVLPAHLLRGKDLSTSPFLRSPVGTGPYRLAAWRAGASITLERWERYWGERARIPRIAYRLAASPDLALRLARRGEIDFISRLRPNQLALELPRDPVLRHGFIVSRDRPPGTTYVLLNHRRPLFADARVRRALALLLDLDTIMAKIMLGIGKRIPSLYWLGDPDYDSSLTPYPFDPARARRLLAEAGFGDSDGNGVLDRAGEPLRFTFLLVASSQTHKRWITMYQEELRKAGVVMEMSPIDWAAYLERLRRHDFDAAALGIRQVGPFTDLYYQLHSSQIEDGQNYGAYRSSAADELMEQIRFEADPAKRRALGKKLQRLIHDETVVIPLFSEEEPGLFSRRVHGVYTSPLWYQLREFWLEP